MTYNEKTNVRTFLNFLSKKFSFSESVRLQNHRKESEKRKMVIPLTTIHRIKEKQKPETYKPERKKDM